MSATPLCILRLEAFPMRIELEEHNPPHLIGMGDGNGFFIMDEGPVDEPG